MKDFKEYPKRYEDVFTSKRKDRYADINKVSVGDKNEDIDQYLQQFGELLDGYQEYVFNFLVKYDWLCRKYRYNDLRRRKQGRNYFFIDASFSLFMRKYLNVPPAIVTRSYFARIIGYFDDLFPNFEEGDPFKEEYLYPYKYMNFACLVLVNELPERIELLRIGEDKNMKYLQFFDYVINHVMCRNEEEEDKYKVRFNAYSSPSFFQKVNPKKYEERKCRRTKKKA